MNTFYIDGSYVQENKAVLPVTDLAVLRGYGVFDFLRTYNGIPFHLEDHIIRLERSAKLIGLSLPESREDIAKIVEKLLKENNHPESNIRLLITGGESSDSISPGKNQRLLIMVTPVKKMPPNWYEDGVKVITAHMDRFIPQSKSINYIPAILNLQDAAERDAIESLYVNPFGYIKEGTTSNFFAFFGDTLVTPPERILPGITRQVVMEIAAKEFEVVERDVHIDELRLVDEAVISASNKEVVPVVKIDAITVFDGEPGPKVKRLMELFRSYTKKYGISA